VNSWGSYEILGDTRDDAVGEAFDKVARILGLPYPGGPEISKLAEQARSLQLPASRFQLPRPMIHSKDLDFSFSGLKTAVLYLVQKLTAESQKLEANEQMIIAREFEDAVTEVLVKKTTGALDIVGASTLIIGGGVVANTHIRNYFQKLCDERNISLLLPSAVASTDNALMIAAAGYITYLSRGLASGKKDFKATGNLSL